MESLLPAQRHGNERKILSSVFISNGVGELVGG